VGGHGPFRGLDAPLALETLYVNPCQGRSQNRLLPALEERVRAAVLDGFTGLFNRLLDSGNGLIKIRWSRLDVPLLDGKLLGQPFLLKPLLRVVSHEHSAHDRCFYVACPELRVPLVSDER